jgi:hypothetical protein
MVLTAMRGKSTGGDSTILLKRVQKINDNTLSNEMFVDAEGNFVFATEEVLELA